VYSTQYFTATGRACSSTIKSDAFRSHRALPVGTLEVPHRPEGVHRRIAGEPIKLKGG